MADDAKPEGEEERVASKGPIVVMWTVQTSMILCTTIMVGYAMIYLKFVMVPLLMAYFLIFLMAPILDIMEKRPMKSPFGKPPENPDEWDLYEKTYEAKMCCVAGYESEKRASIVRKLNALTPAQQKMAHLTAPLQSQLTAAELVTMGQIPHGIATLITLLIVILVLMLLGSVRATSGTLPQTGAQADRVCCADHRWLLWQLFRSAGRHQDLCRVPRQAGAVRLGVAWL